jgi:hypothetical protein
MEKNMVNVEDACNMAGVCRAWRDTVTATKEAKLWWNRKGPRPRYMALANYNHYNARHRQALFSMFKTLSPPACQIITAYAWHALGINVQPVAITNADTTGSLDPESTLVTSTTTTGDYFQLYFCCDNRVILSRTGSRYPWKMIGVGDLIAPYKTNNL